MQLKQTALPTLKQTMNLSFGMRQSLQILMMNRMELCVYAEEQLQENPTAEAELLADGYASYDDFSNVEAGIGSLQEEMMSRIRLLDHHCDLDIAAGLLENCDARGYLKVSEHELADYLHVSIRSVRTTRDQIRSIDPKGITSLTLEECLLSQLEHDKDEQMLKKLIQNHLRDLASGRINKTADALHTTVEDVQRLFARVQKLNPMPGIQFGNEHTPYIRPDIEILNSEDGLQAVPIRYLRIVIHNFDSSNTSAEDAAFIKTKVQQARNLQQCIQLREKTLSDIIQIMIEVQADYLLGTAPRNVLSLTDLSSSLNLHPSTISRAIHDKYYEFNGNIRPVKGLLCRSMNSHSRDDVKEAVLNLIQEETAALSDQEISNLLKERGISCSRRTIAKYRSEMCLKPSHSRNASLHMQKKK